MKNNNILALSRKLLLALVLIFFFTLLITTLTNVYLDPSWKDDRGRIWYLISESLNNSYSILFSILTLISLVLSISANILTKNLLTKYIHQIPKTDKYFTGRKILLDDFEKNISKSKANIFGIHGMGGLGKTTLAIAFANQIAKKFDAELFLDMRGQSDKPITIDEAMLHVVKSFDSQFSNLEDKSLIKGAYQSILNEIKILILMDNVKDDAQIVELTPGEGSILLFTSRKNFSLPNSFQRELPLMSDEESYQFLKKIAPRVSRQDAGRIAELCGYLPIALSKAGHSITKYLHISIDEYISKLAEAKNRVGLIDASTSLSYNLLSNELKIAWRKLSILQNDFGQEVASFIIVGDEKQTADILLELLDLNLIHPDIALPTVPNKFDIGEMRFKFHELDRLFANSKIKNKERVFTELTIVEYYSTVLNTIYVYFDRGGNDFLVSLSAFDREWANISQAQSIGMKHAKKIRRAAELCVGLCLNATKFLDIRFPKEKIVEWSETAVKVSRWMKSQLHESVALSNLGTAYSDMGEVDRAIPLLNQSIEIAKTINMPEVQTSPLGNLASAYRRKGDYVKSLEYHFESYKIAKEIKDTKTIPGTLTNIGNVYRDKGDLKEAIHYHTSGLDMAKEYNLEIEEINALLNLAMDYVISRRILLAVKNNWRAISLAKKFKIKRLQYLALGLYIDMFKTIGLGLAGRVEYFRNKLAVSTVGK